MQKKRSQRLNLVLQLIQREEESERKKVGVLQSLLQEAEAQLQSLLSYQCEYHEQLTADGSGLSSVQHLQSLHLFISRLGHVIEQQKQKEASLRHQLDEQTHKWRKVHQRRNNMQEFTQRCIKEEDLAAEKREQRNIDDAVCRRAYKTNLPR